MSATTTFRSLCIACLLLAFTHLCFAQERQDNKEEDNLFRRTLLECIDYAIKNNVGIRQSELGVVSSQVAINQAKADLLPSVNGSASYNYNLGRSVNPFTNQYEENPVSSQSYGLSSNLTLFNGLQKLNTIKRNRSDLAISQYNLEDTKNTITLNVISAYTQILFNTELLESARLRTGTTDLQLARTQKLVAAGSLPEANVLPLQAQKATDELEIINAENNLAISKLQLKQLLQIPADRTLEIVIPELDVPEEAEIVVDAQDIYETAVQEQPAIKSAEARILSSQYDVAIAKGNRYPNLSISGGVFSSYSSVAPNIIPKPGAENVTQLIETGGFVKGNPDMVIVQPQTLPVEFQENTYFNQLDFNLRKFVGINLNIPIFNNLQVASAVSNAEIQMENARYDAINAKNQLRQTIEQAYLDAKAAAKSYAATDRQVTSLREAFRSTETRFNLGGVNAVEFSQAKADLNTAESDLIRAKYDYIFSLKLLDFYQGKPIDF